jgi:probable FeS assembly SUF system protein SufT
MRMTEEVTVTRDVEAVVVPAGNRILVPQGVTVTITQALGGAFTIITPQGYMARVEGRNADALGKEPLAAVAATPVEATPGTEPGSLEEKIWSQLRSIYDPEIPVNIVDLGLIYECAIEETEGGAAVEIKMTMTAPGCGMGDVLRAEAEQKVGALEGVSRANVEIVWDPPWDQSRMSEAARLELGFG